MTEIAGGTSELLKANGEQLVLDHARRRLHLEDIPDPVTDQCPPHR